MVSAFFWFLTMTAGNEAFPEREKEQEKQHVGFSAARIFCLPRYAKKASVLPIGRKLYSRVTT